MTFYLCLLFKEKRDKKTAEAATTSRADSSNPTGVVRKKAKRSNTRCTNYASVQESQIGVYDQLGSGWLLVYGRLF